MMTQETVEILKVYMFVVYLGTIGMLALLGTKWLMSAIRNGRSGYLPPDPPYDLGNLSSLPKVNSSEWGREMMPLPPQMIGHAGIPSGVNPDSFGLSGELKVWPKYFDALWSGVKTWELRLDDRGYTVGQTWLLREYQPVYTDINEAVEYKGFYPGRSIKVEITYVIDRDCPFGLAPGWVIWSFREIERKS